MEFLAETFTSADFQEFINQDMSSEDKVFWCAGYLWWPIDTEFLNRYISETGNIPFKVIYNGEVIGHFNIWDDNKNTPGKIRVSRGLIYPSFRNKIKDGKPYCYWLAKLAISKAQELYPGKNIRILVYDKNNNHWNKRKNSGLACFESAGFVEYEREIISSSSGKPKGMRIRLEYNDPSAN